MGFNLVDDQYLRQMFFQDLITELRCNFYFGFLSPHSLVDQKFLSGVSRTAVFVNTQLKLEMINLNHAPSLYGKCI